MSRNEFSFDSIFQDMDEFWNPPCIGAATILTTTSDIVNALNSVNTLTPLLPPIDMSIGEKEKKEEPPSYSVLPDDTLLRDEDTIIAYIRDVVWLLLDKNAYNSFEGWQDIVYILQYLFSTNKYESMLTLYNNLCSTYEINKNKAYSLLLQRKLKEIIKSETSVSPECIVGEWLIRNKAMKIHQKNAPALFNLCVMCIGV